MTEPDSRVPDMRKREALLIHIEGLQVSLTKRNQRIEELQNMMTEPLQSEAVVRRIDRARKEGWEACADLLASSTHEMARALGRVRHDAMAVYFKEAERARGESHNV